MNGIVACVTRWLLGAALAGTWLAVPSFAADTIRLAVQKTGTVAWELNRKIKFNEIRGFSACLPRSGDRTRSLVGVSRKREYSG